MTGVEHPTVFGHSFGAAVTLAYATRYPSRLPASFVTLGKRFPAAQSLGFDAATTDLSVDRSCNSSGCSDVYVLMGSTGSRHDVEIDWPSGLYELYVSERLAFVKLAYLICDDRGVAEDVVQDSFVVVAGRWAILSFRVRTCGRL